MDSGGPYDAQDEIGEHFDKVASNETIKAAVDQVTASRIYDWAPKHIVEDGDDLAAGIWSSIGNEHQWQPPTAAVLRDAQADVLQSLRDIELLCEDALARIYRSHNRSPEYRKSENSLTKAQAEDLIRSVKAISEEIRSTEPNLNTVRSHVDAFTTVRAVLLSSAVIVGEGVIGGPLGNAGDALAKMAWNEKDAIAAFLMLAIDAINHWMTSISAML